MEKKELKQLISTLKNIDYVGVDYLLEGVNILLKKDVKLLDFSLAKDIYSELGKKYDKTEVAISACIKRGIERIRQECHCIEDKFDNCESITVKKFLINMIKHCKENKIKRI